MRTIIFLIAVFIASVINAQETKGTSVTVTVQNLKDKGQVRLALYTQDNFMKQPIMAKGSEIENGVATVVFENVPAGEYAILGFHDENENNQMDFDMSGMPKELYGSSNNNMSFGPPQWDDSKFTIGNEPVELELKF